MTVNTSELLLISRLFEFVRCIVEDSVVKVVGAAELVEVMTVFEIGALDEVIELVLD